MTVMRRATLIILAPIVFMCVTLVAHAQTDLWSLLGGNDAPLPSVPVPAETIQPSGRINLLIDSDSYTPPFYRGRALPTAGARVRMEARASFGRADSLIYTWRRNGSVLGAISGKGKSVATIEAPPPYGADTISVQVQTTDGSISDIASIQLASVEPVLTLHQDHPLFGIMYHQAMGAQTSIPDSEMTFVATPYYATIASPDDRALTYTWSVNGKSVSPNAVRPSALTINAEGSSGLASIGLTVDHATNFLTHLTGAWNATFQSRTGAANPFVTQ